MESCISNCNAYIYSALLSAVRCVVSVSLSGLPVDGVPRNLTRSWYIGIPTLASRDIMHFGLLRAEDHLLYCSRTFLSY